MTVDDTAHIRGYVVADCMVMTLNDFGHLINKILRNAKLFEG